MCTFCLRIHVCIDYIIIIPNNHSYSLFCMQHSLLFTLTYIKSTLSNISVSSTCNELISFTYDELVIKNNNYYLFDLHVTMPVIYELYSSFNIISLILYIDFR